MTWIRTALLTLLASGVTTSAFAQDSDLDDLLGGGSSDSGESTVAEERRAVESGAEEASAQPETLPDKRKKVIVTRVPKPYTKIGRFEAVPYVGLVTNEPFIRRVMFGANLGYHVTEIFEVELQGSFAPDFGEGDWKAITRQITGDNQVSPEISRMVGHLTANFNYSPFYGKIAATGDTTINFDVYGTFGVGMAFTSDDLELIGTEGDPRAEATRNQVHPAISFGAGLRVAFNKTFALRFEGRSLSYIGVLDSTKLELKNNLALMLGASIFFGGRSE